MKGRKPKPTAGHGPGGKPKCPAWLGADAKVEWRRLCKLLAGTDVLTSWDADVLSTYCETLCVWRAAIATLTAEGSTYVTAAGLRKRNPAAAIASAAQKDLIRLGEALGLSPLARQRLSITVDPAADELNEFNKPLRIAE